MEKLWTKNPIYPLLCFPFSLIALFGGLLISKQAAFPYFLGAVILVFLLFGYLKPLLYCLAIFVPLAAVVGILTGLVAGEARPALQMAGRLILLGLSAVMLISTPPVTLCRALTRHHVPRALTLGMLVAVRFVPILGSEMGRIRQAMRTRGVRVSLSPACFYRAFFLPLVVRLISISEILSLSIETRGFALDDKGATVFRPVSFKARDGVFAAFTLATLLFFICYLLRGLL